MESYQHLDAKLDIYYSLLADGYMAELEKPIGNGRADVFVEIDDKKLAIEYQRTLIPASEVRRRYENYTRHNVYTLWVMPNDRTSNDLKSLEYKMYIQGITGGSFALHKHGQVFTPAKIENRFDIKNNQVITNNTKMILLSDTDISIPDFVLTINDYGHLAAMIEPDWWLESYLEFD